METENNLPFGWRLVGLTDIVPDPKKSIKRGPFGSAIKKAYFVSEGYKVYEQQNIIYDDFNLGHYYIDEEKFQELKDFEVKSGDILISCSGTIGKIVIAPENIKRGIINQALLKITLDSKKINSKYFLYLFRSDILQKRLKTRGTAITNITGVKELKKVEFPLPPLPIQEKIVAKLDAFFEKYGEMKELNENNKFGQTRILKKAIAQLIPQNYLKDDWNEDILKNLFEIKYGKGLPMNKRKKGDIPVFGSNGIIGYHTDSIVKHDTIVIGRKGSVGEINLALNESWPIDTTYYTESKTSEADTRFFFYTLQLCNLKKDTSSAIPGVRRTDLYKIRIKYPGPELQKQIIRKINQIEEQKTKIAEEQKIIDKNLGSLSKAVLAKAFSGDLVV